ncbi:MULTISPECIES: YceD family protein [Lachnospira]|uniref:ACR, COG1399 n=2 Tax=Lachnospira TaxID=28050 RepID=A0A1H5RPU1_9FIRM|nr:MULTISPECIES: DUF177 domain-containing protein [Lachnospira]MBQ2473316.1 DUF177 domain-containing protein [Lachnospira sp.]MCR5514885.1 DUF177 domain-containing protein [Lachnospira sp.]SDM72821.1 uncharacterized protein SAMN05216544_0998 [Lachnospira pectinoschiza]SEF39567.1 uncharacterized protein SAMN05216537_101169 [Lachnospira multipara]
MLIDLRELLSGSSQDLTKNVSLEADTFNNGLFDYPIVKKAPFDVTINKIGTNKISIKAVTDVTLSIPCDRCLTAVDTKVDLVIDEIVDFADDASEEETQIEKDYIDGYNLDADKLLFSELLVSMPGKTLCKEDCKGLCLKCGTNLNIKECGCDREVLDPRMSVFKDILNEFKEV